MVPIETLTSMFMEPSSGSYSTTYLPAAFPGGTGTGSGSSSDAVTHTRPVCCTLKLDLFANETVRNSVQHTGTGSGPSSHAVTHTRPARCTLVRTVSFANRS